MPMKANISTENVCCLNALIIPKPVIGLDTVMFYGLDEFTRENIPGRVAQSVKCLTADTRLTAVPAFAS